MTQDTLEFLEHHGVKGMKWGVRNDTGHKGERATTKKIAKLDKKFNRVSRGDAVLKIYNRAADLCNKNTIPKINNKPEYKGQNFKKDSPLRQKYYKEYQAAYIHNLEIAANEMGTNASGTKKYSIVAKSNGSWNVLVDDVKHASTVEMSLKINFDENGLITSIEVVDPVIHSDDISEFLEHHGVKGMHWGIRTGHNRTTSSDYKKTAPYRKRKAQELTNKQLKNVNERINLEQNYKRLNQSTVKKGEAAAKGIIGLAGTATALYTLSNSPAAKALVNAGKHAILTAKILKVVHSIS